LTAQCKVAFEPGREDDAASYGSRSMSVTDDFELPFPQYRCTTCNTDLPLNEAWLAVTCGNHDRAERIAFDVRVATDDDRSDIELICERASGETELDIFGRTFDVLAGQNIVAVADGELLGVLSLAVVGGEANVILLSVYPDFQGKGVATALLEAADVLAAKRGLDYLRAAVTNDDIPQLYFYQRHGFAIYEVAVGEVADRFGSVSPGFSAIPVRDELRLRRAVRA
jgi:ribosomal protein S18 acetylase RimI-like enzyme